MSVLAFSLQLVVASVASVASDASDADADAVSRDERVLVLDVNATNVDVAVARAATDAVADAIGTRRRGAHVVTERDLTAVADSEKARTTLDCRENAECLAELSRWSSARWVVSGTLGRVGRTTMFTLSLADAEAASVVGREAIELESVKPQALAAAAEQLVARIFRGERAAEKETPSKRFTVAKGERASYAVFPLELEAGSDMKIDPAVARSLTDILALEIKRVDGTTVVSIDDVAAMVSAEQKQSVLTCSDDASCLAEIGAALDVDRLVVSRAAKLADTYVVSARLLDVKKVRVLSRVTETFVGPEEQLIRAVRHCARELLGATGARGAAPTGSLVVTTPEVGAIVFIDGKERGRTPTAPIDGVAAGRHSLRVVQNGLLDWQGDVYVDPGETTAQWVVADEKPTLLRPFLPEWAFYGTVTVAAVALVGGGVLGSITLWSQADYDAIGEQSVTRPADGESVVVPRWNRTMAFATPAAILLTIGAGAGLTSVAALPVVDFAE